MEKKSSISINRIELPWFTEFHYVKNPIVWDFLLRTLHFSTHFSFSEREKTAIGTIGLNGSDYSLNCLVEIDKNSYEDSQKNIFDDSVVDKVKEYTRELFAITMAALKEKNPESTYHWTPFMAHWFWHKIREIDKIIVLSKEKMEKLLTTFDYSVSHSEQKKATRRIIKGLTESTTEINYSDLESNTDTILWSESDFDLDDGSYLSYLSKLLGVFLYIKDKKERQKNAAVLGTKIGVMDKNIIVISLEAIEEFFKESCAEEQQLTLEEFEKLTLYHEFGHLAFHENDKNTPKDDFISYREIQELRANWFVSSALSGKMDQTIKVMTDKQPPIYRKPVLLGFEEPTSVIFANFGSR